MTPNILEGKASPRRKANTIWELTRNPTRDKNGLPGVKPAGIPSGVSSSAIATAMRTFQGPTRKLPYSMAMDEALAEKFGRDKTNSDERAKCIRAQHPYDNVHRGVRGDLELIADIPLGHLFDLYLNMAPPLLPKTSSRHR